jgi:hypothetical protein
MTVAAALLQGLLTSLSLHQHVEYSARSDLTCTHDWWGCNDSSCDGGASTQLTPQWGPVKYQQAEQKKKCRCLCSANTKNR